MAESSLGHHCGVAAIYASKPTNIPEQLFFPLFAQQHRGQESAGIAYRKDDHLVAYKDLGMVSTVLSRYLNENRESTVGIGHVRYSTRGGNKIENAQPILVNSNKGEIALAHNGNISNTPSIKDSLFEEGSIFQTSSDSELILHLMSRSRQKTFIDALLETLGMIEGAFSMVMIHDTKLVAIRDPWGFRPLYVGQDRERTVVASETCALDIMKIRDYRSVEAGEILLIDDSGIQSLYLEPTQQKKQCIFELIYFARPDSKVFDNSVHLRRKKMGAALAERDRGLDVGDVVVPVPDSGNHAALGYSEASGVPFDLGLTRNHYAGRSFIMPTTAERELAVRMKLHPVTDVIEGRRIILVDDSLVRGTTAGILVRLIRDAGAREVHLRLSSPEIRWPCFFGIDIPTRRQLISNFLEPDEIADHIGADSVRFLTLEELSRCVDNPDEYCYACFTGEYPLPVPLTKEELAISDRRELPSAIRQREYQNART